MRFSERLALVPREQHSLATDRLANDGKVAVLTGGEGGSSPVSRKNPAVRRLVGFGRGSIVVWRPCSWIGV